ncbi:LysR family transcriptional regulator [Nioella aestuarii]|uniref:LysR family transcriptional regulator n=1 Tax=Nioella aestuarii TaxID=1662864 RepID=UPI003D7FE67E
MVNWDDLRTVLALVRHRTLAGAGTALGLNYTTVARRISRAEEALGTVLFDRLADGYVPTEAALAVARNAERMELAEFDLTREVAARDETLAGQLVITAPQLLIGPYLAPIMAQFSQAHPEVELVVRATNELLDLTRREADLAIRISRDPGDDLMGLRLAEQQTASFASPDLAAQIAEAPQMQIPWVSFVSMTTPPKVSLEAYPNAYIRMKFDDVVPVIGAAREGLGVARLPMFIGRREPGLVQVPLLPPQPYADIWLVGHKDVWRAAKPRAFRDMLVPYFRARRGDFVA